MPFFVIPEKAGIQQFQHVLDAGSGLPRTGYGVRHDVFGTFYQSVNIRTLPLKTLLVYLDMEGVITPKFTYFEEYFFKYNRQPANIINSFQGERKQFVAAIIEHCSTKKAWTYVDIQGILNSYNTDRSRIITALEYLEEKGWIELQARQAIEVCDIKTRAFNIDMVAGKMYNLFKTCILGNNYMHMSVRTI